jgi:hypothetical protein
MGGALGIPWTTTPSWAGYGELLSKACLQSHWLGWRQLVHFASVSGLTDVTVPVPVGIDLLRAKFGSPFCSPSVGIDLEPPFLSLLCLPLVSYRFFFCQLTKRLTTSSIFFSIQAAQFILPMDSI